MQILHESSTPAKPKWIENSPRENETLYFVGIKTSAETLEEGQTAALKDAMSKISSYLGSKIVSVFEDYTTEIEQKLKQQIVSKSSATVHGARLTDWYYEKMIRIEGDYRLEKYDVYVLVIFSKEEVSKEIGRQDQEKRDRIKTAYDYYLKGVESEKENKYRGARDSYKQALSALTDIDDVISVDSKDIKNSEDLRLRLKNKIQNANAQLSKISLSININGLNRPNQVFQSNLASSFNERGFTITDKQPAIEITGTVAVSEGSYVMNNNVYYAEGSVSALSVSDQQVLAVYPFKCKGFHKSKEQAAMNALQEAGIEAGRNLSKMIRDKEKADNLR